VEERYILILIRVRVWSEGSNTVYSEVNSRLATIVPAVIDRLPVILSEVRELLADEHPDYAGFLAEEFDEVVAASVGFVGRLVGVAQRAPDGSPAGPGLEQSLFEGIGREHFRHGQDLAGLMAAYRTGAVVAWRHVAQVALERGASSEAFAMLASTVFTAVDQLSAASLRGYALEQSESAPVQDRLRDELANLLLSDRSDTATIRAAADRADWPLPLQASVVLVDPDNDAARIALARLDPACLRIRGREMFGVIVPDPAGPRRRARLANQLRGTNAVIGSAVPLDRLPASLHIAEIAVRLRRTQVLDDDPLFVGEHLDALIVHHDERLLAALRRRYLAPLDVLPAPTRERLASTLTCWLLHMGNRQAMAGALHVHPQTVRYRMAQLRTLFGPTLDDPSVRATLLLALAWGPAADGTAEAPPPRTPRPGQSVRGDGQAVRVGRER
jgi:hypothetical protein